MATLLATLLAVHCAGRPAVCACVCVQGRGLAAPFMTSPEISACFSSHEYTARGMLGEPSSADISPFCFFLAISFE
eukprot:SAG22_NODE_622_length_8493_cov_196.309864_2_plen_76_part_00